ncbi:hypothetical protein [Bacteroides ovatus]|uniref:hypothetical protein n=1 Tax=Bacteroides ovatus TaxID=28116 RepID=UPI001F2DB7B3|nr:hypothetical protein [Bacteroides ovatus]MCE8924932.1 hypothetical protein [Bacteroides ovatus]
MNSLANSIYEHLERNKWPYSHYSYDDEDIFKVGVYGEYQIMLLRISVPKNDSTQYKMECSYLEFATRTNNGDDSYKHITTNVKKDYTDKGVVFTLERTNLDNYDDSLFINDFDSLTEICDKYNGEIPLETFLCDEWLSFIEDLTNITFSASNGDMLNAGETNSKLISNIVTEMGLNEKLELFRSPTSDNLKYPYYPKDKKSQCRYIRGLLRLIFNLEKIAYEEKFQLVSNNILFMAMRGMGFSQQERQAMIVDEFRPFLSSFPKTVSSNILESYCYMSNDMNRAYFLFESEGIVDECGVE